MEMLENRASNRAEFVRESCSRSAIFGTRIVRPLAETGGFAGASWEVSETLWNFA